MIDVRLWLHASIELGGYASMRWYHTDKENQDSPTSETILFIRLYCMLVSFSYSDILLSLSLQMITLASWNRPQLLCDWHSHSIGSQLEIQWLNDDLEKCHCLIVLFISGRTKFNIPEDVPLKLCDVEGSVIDEDVFPLVIAESGILDFELKKDSEFGLNSYFSLYTNVENHSWTSSEDVVLESPVSRPRESDIAISPTPWIIPTTPGNCEAASGALCSKSVQAVSGESCGKSAVTLQDVIDFTAQVQISPTNCRSLPVDDTFLQTIFLACFHYNKWIFAGYRNVLKKLLWGP